MLCETCGAHWRKLFLQWVVNGICHNKLVVLGASWSAVSCLVAWREVKQPRNVKVWQLVLFAQLPASLVPVTILHISQGEFAVGTLLGFREQPLQNCAINSLERLRFWDLLEMPPENMKIKENNFKEKSLRNEKSQDGFTHTHWQLSWI